MDVPKIQLTIQTESGELLLRAFIPIDMLGRFLAYQGQQLETIAYLQPKPANPIPPIKGDT